MAQIEIKIIIDDLAVGIKEMADILRLFATVPVLEPRKFPFSSPETAEPPAPAITPSPGPAEPPTPEPEPEPPAPATTPAPDAEFDDGPPVEYDALIDLLRQKTEQKKGPEIKKIIKACGATKISEVDPKYYPHIYKKAEQL